MPISEHAAKTLLANRLKEAIPQIYGTVQAFRHAPGNILEKLAKTLQALYKILIKIKSNVLKPSDVATLADALCTRWKENDYERIGRDHQTITVLVARVKQICYELQMICHKPLPSIWAVLSPAIKNVLPHLKAPTIGDYTRRATLAKDPKAAAEAHRQNMSKGTTNFESRLVGRMAMLECTNTANHELGRTNLRKSFGTKLANLVENGDRKAIELTKLIAERRGLKRTGCTDMVLMENVETRIAKTGKEIGVPIEETANELATMLSLAASPNNFRDRKHFRTHLMEGLLLNINHLASDALSIPAGQYVVWTTDAGKTMLVPTNESADRAGGAVMADRPERFDLVTADLLNCWNKVERRIFEG